MKRQPKTSRLIEGSKSGSKNGTKIARDLLDVTNRTIAMDFTAVHPIDTLLVQQLEDILDGERALRARYSSLDPSANTPEVRMAFSKELSELKDRADRLYRLVSAMDCYGLYEPRHTRTEAVAVV